MRRGCALLIAWLLGCPLAWAAGPESGTSEIGQTPYVVGVTPQFQAQKLFEIWRPILDALEKQTGLRFTLRGAASIDGFEQQYSAGMFDFAYANPYFVGVRNYQGYLPLVRDHGSNLAGVVVVRADSPVRDVRELDGQAMAFPSANALAGCLVIRAQLEDELGVRVQPRFVRTHDSSYLNVAVGSVAAAGGTRATLERQEPAVRDRLRVIWTSRELANLPFVAHPRVPGAVRQRIRDALLKMGETAEGRAMLAKVPIRQIGPAELSDYAPLGRMRLERYEN